MDIGDIKGGVWCHGAKTVTDVGKVQQWELAGWLLLYQWDQAGECRGRNKVKVKLPSLLIN